MFSEAPRDSACGFWGDQAHSQPLDPRVMRPLSPDPRFYQEIRERGLTTSQESDDDLLDEPGSPEGARTVGTPIVVKNFRAPQVTWSQLPEVGRLLGAPFPTVGSQSRGLPRRPPSPRRAASRALRAALPARHLVVSGGGGGGGVGAGAIQVGDGRPQVNPVLSTSSSDWPLGSCGYQGPLLPESCPQESARRSPEEAGGDGAGGQASAPTEPRATAKPPPLQRQGCGDSVRAQDEGGSDHVPGSGCHPQTHPAPGRLLTCPWEPRVGAGRQPWAWRAVGRAHGPTWPLCLHPKGDES